MSEPTREQVFEALNLLQEECAEIIQIISKIRRFGFNSYYPSDPTKRMNKLLLNDEVGDFETVKEYLSNAGVLDLDHIEARKAKKRESMRKYTTLYK